MNTKPTISVIMSVYNASDYLKDAIESILNQTFSDFEFLIIDDHSTDSSVDIIKKFVNQDTRVRLFINHSNLGLTKNLNTLIKIAKGNYIARMDADDISLPYRFEKQILFLEKNKEIMVLGTYIQDFMSNKVIKYPLTDNYIRKVVAKSSPLGHPSVIIRKSVFESGLLYQEKYRTNQDLALWFDILSKGYKIANLPEPLLKYRRTKDTYRKRKKKAFNEFKIFIAGIWKLNGLSAKLVYPFLRLIARLLPTVFIRTLYNNNKFNRGLNHFLKN